MKTLRISAGAPLPSGSRAAMTEKTAAIATAQPNVEQQFNLCDVTNLYYEGSGTRKQRSLTPGCLCVRSACWSGDAKFPVRPGPRGSGGWLDDLITVRAKSDRWPLQWHSDGYPDLARVGNILTRYRTRLVCGHRGNDYRAAVQSRELHNIGIPPRMDVNDRTHVPGLEVPDTGREHNEVVFLEHPSASNRVHGDWRPPDTTPIFIYTPPPPPPPASAPSACAASPRTSPWLSQVVIALVRWPGLVRLHQPTRPQRLAYVVRHLLQQSTQRRHAGLCSAFYLGRPPCAT